MENDTPVETAIIKTPVKYDSKASSIRECDFGDVIAILPIPVFTSERSLEAINKRGEYIAKVLNEYSDLHTHCDEEANNLYTENAALTAALAAEQAKTKRMEEELKQANELILGMHRWHPTEASQEYLTDLAASTTEEK